MPRTPTRYEDALDRGLARLTARLAVDDAPEVQVFRRTWEAGEAGGINERALMALGALAELVDNGQPVGVPPLEREDVLLAALTLAYFAGRGTVFLFQREVAQH